MNNVAEFLSSLNVNENEYALIKKAVKILERNENKTKNVPWGKKRCILPSAERFQGIWNWDTAFHAVGISRIDMEFAMEHMEAFCEFQLEDGMFPDVVFCNGETVDTFTKPPVMAWACETVYRRSGDKAFLKRMYDRLVKNTAFWETKRRVGEMFHYDALELNGKKDMHHVGCESGWDNSVRWDNSPDKLWAIDLNCFMVMTYRSLDFMSKELGIENAGYLEKAERLAKNIESMLWNEKLNCYTDMNFETGALSEVLSPASFMPLYTGIASKEHANKAAKTAEISFGYGMPTVSYDNPEYCEDYWRGPTWLNVAYFAAKGLKDYGFDEIANKIKETILGWIENDKDKIHENYNSKTGEGLCAEYFSWSAVFVMEFILNF